jgi:predicted AAA+ superfamily ATPase
LNIKDLISFQKFIALIAGRTGQLFNQNNISNELGIDNKTVVSWLSVLEASFIAFRLPTFYQNFNKRVLKTPKIYFYDTGVLCRLLGITKPSDLNLHFARGQVFENLIITEIIKKELNQGIKPACYFWRDSNHNEVDLLQEKDGKLHAIEIKASETFHTDFLKGLKIFQKVAPHAESKLIYAGQMVHQRDGIQVSNLWNL